MRRVWRALTNFGVVSDGVGAFNPASAVVYGAGLLVLTAPITVIVMLVMALLFLYGRRSHPMIRLKEAKGV